MQLTQHSFSKKIVKILEELMIHVAPEQLDILKKEF